MDSDKFKAEIDSAIERYAQSQGFQRFSKLSKNVRNINLKFFLHQLFGTMYVFRIATYEEAHNPSKNKENDGDYFFKTIYLSHKNLKKGFDFVSKEKEFCKNYVVSEISDSDWGYAVSNSVFLHKIDNSQIYVTIFASLLFDLKNNEIIGLFLTDKLCTNENGSVSVEDTFLLAISKFYVSLSVNPERRFFFINEECFSDDVYFLFAFLFNSKINAVIDFPNNSYTFEELFLYNLSGLYNEKYRNNLNIVDNKTTFRNSFTFFIKNKDIDNVNFRVDIDNKKPLHFDLQLTADKFNKKAISHHLFDFSEIKEDYNLISYFYAKLLARQINPLLFTKSDIEPHLLLEIEKYKLYYLKKYIRWFHSPFGTPCLKLSGDSTFCLLNLSLKPELDNIVNLNSKKINEILLKINSKKWAHFILDYHLHSVEIKFKRLIKNKAQRPEFLSVLEKQYISTIKKLEILLFFNTLFKFKKSDKSNSN